MFWILLLALILRLIGLNQSLWLDEAFQVKSISNFSLQGLLTRYLPADFNPPLSYMINFFWSRLAGYSEIALRTPSVIFGVFTVYLLYKIGELIFPKQRSSVAALLLATSGLHLYYSQEARMYSLVAMAVTGSFWALLSFLKGQRRLFYYLVFSLVLIYSHYLAWFVLPAQLILVFLLKPTKLKSIVVTQFAAVIGFLPWLPIFFQQLKTGLSAAGANQQWASVVGGANLKNLILIPIKFLIGRLSIENNIVFAAVLFLPLLLASWLFFLAVKHWRQNRFSSLSLFSWFVLPLLMIIIISFKLPVLAYFRLLFLLPAFYLILILGINYLPQFWQKPLIIVLVLINIISSSIYLFNPRFHRENWRRLTQILVEKNHSFAPVVIIPVVDAPLRYYYASNNIIPSDKIESVLDQSELWLVPYAEPIFDPSQQTRQKILQAGFQENFKQHFRGNLTLIQYIK